MMNANQHSQINKNLEIVKLKRQLDTIYKVNCFLSSITDLKKLLRLILEESKKIVNCEASSLMLYDQESEELYFEVVLGDKSDIVKEIRLKMGQGFAGQVAQERKIINVRDVRTGNQHYEYVDQISSFQTKSLLALPLLRGDKLIGVIEVLNKIGDKHFNDEDIKIMEILSEQAAISIENAQLVEYNVKAEKLAAIGQTVAGTAHYIKNILSGISGGMGLIEIGLENKRIELIENTWSIFKRSNSKITKFVNDMLTFSKDREPIKTPTQVKEVIEDVCEIVMEKARQEKITITKSYKNEDRVINIEPVAINDALLNILSNAIDASDKQEGLINISTCLNDENTDIIISITDNGSGITPDIIKRIFEPFFSTKGSKGTGLGLAVTKKIIIEHQGRLEVQSDPEKGTTFIIYLPIIQDYKPLIKRDG